jgi:hypothetical protein
MPAQLTLFKSMALYTVVGSRVGQAGSNVMSMSAVGPYATLCQIIEHGKTSEDVAQSLHNIIHVYTPWNQVTLTLGVSPRRLHGKSNRTSC